MIRNLYVLLGATFLTLVWGSWIVLLSRFVRHRTECSCERLAQRWARAILRMSGVSVRVVGADRIPEEEPVILAVNHQSWFDVFALVAHLPGRARFVGKKELEAVPVFGPAWKACGHISIDREARDRAIESLEVATRTIREQSKIVVMFPEGTRSEDGALQPFKKGAFVLAIQAGVPIVPVAVAGSRAIMPKGAWWIRPGTVEIRIGTPIPVEGLAHRDRDRLRAETWREVARLKGDGEEERGDSAVPERGGRGGEARSRKGEHEEREED